MASRQLPNDFEIVDFEPIEEHWNTYELQNGTIVRGRIIITRFAKDPQDKDPNKISLSSQNVFVVDAPPDQRSAPTGPLSPSEATNPQGTPTDIILNNEKWNKYRIPKLGVTMKVKLIVDDVVRIDGKFDKDGMPQYIFRTTPMILPDRRSNPNDRV